MGTWGDAVNMGFIFFSRILISVVQLGKYQCNHPDFRIKMAYQTLFIVLNIFRAAPFSL